MGYPGIWRWVFCCCGMKRHQRHKRMSDEDDQRNKNSTPLEILPPAGPAPQPTLSPLPETSPGRNSLENEASIRQDPFDDLFVIGDYDSDVDEEVSLPQIPQDPPVGNPFADPESSEVLFDSDAEDDNLPDLDAFELGESDDESVEESDNTGTPLKHLGYENSDDIPDMEISDDTVPAKEAAADIRDNTTSFDIQAAVENLSSDPEPENADAVSNLNNAQDVPRTDDVEATQANTSLRALGYANADSIPDMDEDSDNVPDMTEDEEFDPNMLVENGEPSSDMDESNDPIPGIYSEDDDDDDEESSDKGFNRLDECPINLSPQPGYNPTQQGKGKSKNAVANLLADISDDFFAAPAKSNNSYAPASTARNGQEPFPDFANRVKLLLEGLFPDEDPETVELQRMRGGSYNRVVGVTLANKNERYILRVPRTMKDDPLSRIAKIDITEDIAPLLFVKSVGIPCAEIISFERHPINALRSPYMIQSRVKGECMLDAVRNRSLTHTQRQRVAKEMGQIYNRMLTTTSTVPGRIILPAGNPSSARTAKDLLIAPYGSLEVYPWKKLDEANAAAEPYHPGPVTERRNTYISEFLLNLLQDRKAASPAHFRHHMAIYDKMIKCFTKMQDKQMFDGMDFCLNHGDLWPRNIMVDADAAEDEPMVTILDWDSALFLPAFNMCIPPTWVWDLDNCREPEQMDADCDPIDPLKRELKKIFEDNAGPTFVRYAKEHDYKIGRQLMKTMLRGFPDRLV